jgi:glyceraldehyde 3-phosphate dehydrogenase
MRVPVPTGSATDLTVELRKQASRDDINAAMKAAADGPLRGILEYTEAPIVSADIVTDPASCIFDAPLTNTNGNLAKVLGWYDNEWGYSNRLVDLVDYVAARL